MIETTLPTGAKLQVDLAPFADANGLNKAIGIALRGLNLPAQLMEKEMSLAGLLSDPAAISTFLNLLISVGTSFEVEVAVFACAKRARYNGAPVTPDLFDEREAAREDYYAICAEIIKANCAPFFRKALSGLSALSKTGPASQK